MFAVRAEHAADCSQQSRPRVRSRKYVKERTDERLLNSLPYELLFYCSFHWRIGITRNYSVQPDRCATPSSSTHAAEVCRGQMTQLGSLLPIPESLKTALEAARSGKSGIPLQQANREFATTGYGK